MTKLQWIRTLYQTGLVLQLGHRTYGLYPFRWIGRLILRRKAKPSGTVIKWCRLCDRKRCKVTGRFCNPQLVEYPCPKSKME